MIFLNPILLAGLAAVAIPVIIHLLNKRKYERVTWAAMRFLNIAVAQNERRVKIEDLLLLILRCVMVALLALALARPAISAVAAGVFGQLGVTAVLVVDQSYSMSQTDGTQSRFDKAKTAAGQVLDTLPSGSSAAVWMSSDGVNELIPEPTFDLNLARATIKNAKLSDRRTDVMPALRKALDALSGHAGLRKELYLFTDGQSNGWKQIETIHTMLDGAKDVRTHLIFTTAHEEQNLGVADLKQASGLAAVDRPLRFGVKVSNYGTSEARDVHVVLKVDNGDTADEGTIPSIPPHDSLGVSLFTKLHGEGYHAVSAAIQGDALPADDVRTIVVHTIARVKVLLVDGNPGFSDRESEVFYARAVFGAGGGGSDRALVQASVIAPAELAGTNLDEFEAIILADVPDCSPATLDAIGSYLQRGGGLMVFPGDRMQPAFYNEQFVGKYHFLPASFGTPKGEANSNQKLVSLQDKGFQHPLSAIWNDAGSGSPGSANFFRIAPLTPDTGAASSDAHVIGDPRVVMAFSDGSPAVMERAWGQGRVIQFASTLSTRWNDLPVHPGVYVPLLYRCLGAIVDRQDEGLNIRAGEKWQFHPGVEQLGRDVSISRPNSNTASARDTRRVEMTQRLPTINYDETDVAGVYDVAIGDSSPMRFAVQPDPEESHLEDLSEAEKHSLDSVASVIEWTPTVSLEQELARRRLGTELWLPIAGIVLAMAAVETFLAHWFSRSK